jgi:hypothetical protein
LWGDTGIVIFEPSIMNAEPVDNLGQLPGIILGEVE